MTRADSGHHAMSRPFVSIRAPNDTLIDTTTSALRKRVRSDHQSLVVGPGSFLVGPWSFCPLATLVAPSTLFLTPT
jgi:hypothetical protein